MSERIALPAFQSEAEEADWWFENREQHAEAFVQAMAEGRVKRTNLAQRVARARGVPVIDMEAEDISKAQELAQKKGMEVASYLSLLVHEALEREAKQAS
jgi:hypothetical protein